MFYRMSIIGFLTIIFLFFACSNNNQSETHSSTVKKINAQEFITLQKSKPNLLILDVRTADEISKGKIPTAVTEDFFNDNFETNLEKLDNSRPVAVYCKSGGRSGKTTKILEKLGFKEIYDLKDGYKSWAATQK